MAGINAGPNAQPANWRYSIAPGGLSIASYPGTVQFDGIVFDDVSLFSDVATIQAARIPSVVNSISTAGYYSAGDGGAAQYTRIGAAAPGSIQSLDGQYWGIRPEQAFNVRQFGARGDNSANDTTACQAAIDATQAAGGGDLYWTTGIYRVTTLNVAASTVVNFIGEREQTVIRATTATGTVVTHGAWYSFVEKIKFDSAVTRTGGAYLQMTGAQQYVNYCLFDGDFIGIRMSSVGGRILFNEFRNGANGARRIWLEGGDTSQLVLGNLFNSQAPGVSAGIFIDNNAAVKIYGNDIIGQGRCVHIAPGNGQAVFSIYSRDNFFDTAAIGLAIEPSGTGVVQRCSFLGDWFGSHTGSGITVNPVGAATVNGLDFVNCDVYGNAADGITLAGATSNVRINNVKSKQNATGLSIAATVTNVYVDGLYCNPGDGWNANNFGIFIAAANGYYIRNSDVSGQTTANIAGHTPAANRVVDTTVGYVSSATGTASIGAGATSIVVNHGLGSTPVQGQIMVTPTSALGSATEFWVSNLTATQFTINLDLAPGAAVGFAWRAALN